MNADKQDYQDVLDAYTTLLREFDNLVHLATNPDPPDAGPTYQDDLYNLILLANNMLMDAAVKIDRRRADDPAFDAFMMQWAAQGIGLQNADTTTMH